MRLHFFRKIICLILLYRCATVVKAQYIDSTYILNQINSIEFQSEEEILTFKNQIDSLSYTLSTNSAIKIYDRFYNAVNITNNKAIRKDSICFEVAKLIAINYVNSFNYTEARNAIQKALDHAYTINSSILIADGFNGLGIIYMNEGMHAKAIDAYLKAIEECKKSRNSVAASSFIYSIYNNISICYYGIGEYEEAIKYLNLTKSYHENEQHTNAYDLTYLYRNLAINYKYLENKDSSDLYFNKLLSSTQSLADSLKNTSQNYFDKKLLLSNYIYITEQYLKRGNLERAKIYYERCQPWRLTNNSSIAELDILYAIKTKNLAKAKQLIKQSENSFNLKNSLRYYQILSEYHESKGDFKQALHFERENSKQEIDNLKNQRILFSSYVENKIHSIEQQRKIEALTHEQQMKEKVTSFSQGISILLLVLLGLLFYTYFQIKNKNKLLTNNLEKQKVITKQTNQLKELESQKNSLFTNIAHELQSLLNIIHGLGKEVLSSKKQNLNTFDDAIKIIINKGSDISKSIHRTIEVDQLNKGVIPVDEVYFSVKELFESIMPEFHFLAKEKNIKIELPFVDEEDVILNSDAIKIITIIKNLLSNAIKFSPIDSTISVTSATTENNFYKLSIKDRGRGIPQDKISAIFERYYQTDGNDSKVGLGLGLAICKDYSKHLGGNIQVKSKEGEWSEFSVFIPYEQTNVANLDLYAFPKKIKYDKELAIPMIETPDPVKQELLIIENNLDFCKFLERTLKSEFNLNFKHNGSKALEYLKKHTPDIILTDWMMPELDGFTLINFLKSDFTLRKIPILMLTARSLTSDKTKALRIGVDDYLTKPIEGELLRERLKINLHKNSTLQKGGEQSLIVDDDRSGVSMKDDDWIVRFEEVVYPLISNFDLNLDQVAGLIGLSKKHLNKKVKDITGYTAKGYIQEIRYWEARRLMESKEMDSVKSVCLSVGFKDIKNFSKNFKNKFGRYPSNYLGK